MKEERAKNDPVDAVSEAALNEEASRELEAMVAEVESSAVSAAATDAGAEPAPYTLQSQAERAGVIESLIFVSEEPLSGKTIAEVLKEDRAVVDEALELLVKEFNDRNGGLQLREVAGGWQFATRPEYHEHVRAFLKTRPSA
jgi:segregation and condensation protein B